MNENNITNYLLLLFAIAISVLIVKVIYITVMERKVKIRKMYCTQEGVDVTERIGEGNTKVFDTEEQACYYARQKRSYPYPLYKEDKNGKRNHVGFAVPK
ncbi:hypothetical protein ACFLSU_04660 [Bacteroidota bacterium]